MAACDQSSRRHKYHWKLKTARQPATVMDQVVESVSVVGSWSVSGMSQWQCPTDVIVSSPSDLLHLQQFLVGKVGAAPSLFVATARCGLRSY